jgi:hypothetical protein
LPNEPEKLLILKGNIENENPIKPERNPGKPGRNPRKPEKTPSNPQNSPLATP